MNLIDPQIKKIREEALAQLGLGKRETRDFSISKAIRASLGDKEVDASFERECSAEISKRLDRPVEQNRFFIPLEIQQRDMTVGTAGAGGYLVQTTNSSFVNLLRNRSVAFRMGAQRLPGLQGNVALPRQTVAATPYWLATEATAITASDQTMNQVILSPKTCGAYTKISRQLLLQSSPGAEGIVANDLAQVVALAVDSAVINGTGTSGQPTGILATSGVNSIVGTALDYAKLLTCQSNASAVNSGLQRPGYVTTPAIASLLSSRVRIASTDSPLWSGNIWDANVCGVPGMSSNQMPSATLIFGDWADIIVGEWGVLEVEVNPYENFAAGITSLRVMFSTDVAVLHPTAWSKATTIT